MFTKENLILNITSDISLLFFLKFFFFMIVQKLKFVLGIDFKNNHFYTTFQQLYIPKKFIGQLMPIKLSN